MSGIISYGCATATGDSVEELWTALVEGNPPPAHGTFRFRNRGEGSDLEILTKKLGIAFRAAVAGAPSGASHKLLGGSLGVILASTKGRTNDFIWSADPSAMHEDPLTPLLNAVIRTLELRAERSIVVSNACSSALAAARLAQLWLNQGMDNVLVFAADIVSEFVQRGFQSLKLVSDRPPRPFAADRTGFWLGEAAACFWLSRAHDGGRAVLHPVGLDSEGSAVTRPTLSGESLARAISRIPSIVKNAPDLILAHATATQINDATEDGAFASLFENRPWITGSKWCVGHTLAASGALDLILASEIVRHGRGFPLATTKTVDPRFHGRYWIPGTSGPARPGRVLVTSLGFGGMHAAALVEARR